MDNVEIKHIPLFVYNLVVPFRLRREANLLVKFLNEMKNTINFTVNSVRILITSKYSLHEFAA